MSKTHDLVFLLDCDNTLLDNDRVQVDLRDHLEREFGARSRDEYWAILDQYGGQYLSRHISRGVDLSSWLVRSRQAPSLCSSWS